MALLTELVTLEAGLGLGDVVGPLGVTLGRDAGRPTDSRRLVGRVAALALAVLFALVLAR